MKCRVARAVRRGRSENKAVGSGSVWRSWMGRDVFVMLVKVF